jgi:hypothetical protein
MSVFTNPSHPENVRLRALYPWSIRIFMVLVAGSVIYLWGDWKNLFLLLFGFGGTLWSVTQTIRKKAKAHFVAITRERIEWVLSEQEHGISVPFSNLRWIKQEKDGSIVLARKRKESTCIDLREFPDRLREQIILEIKETAAQQKVDYINFNK